MKFTNCQVNGPFLYLYKVMRGYNVHVVPVVFQVDLMPHDVITQLLRVLAIETKQEKAIINADPTEVSLSGLEAFSFDYIVKWPLSLIINR